MVDTESASPFSGRIALDTVTCVSRLRYCFQSHELQGTDPGTKQEGRLCSAWDIAAGPRNIAENERHKQLMADLSGARIANLVHCTLRAEKNRAVLTRNTPVR